MRGYNSNRMSSGSGRRSKRKIASDSTSTRKWGEKTLLSSSKPTPTRKDSVASAYHHNHMFHKNKSYMNDPHYDAHKKRAKKVAKKFPKLDAYMKVRKNRKKMGYDYE
mgnify:CR=1 FL=1|tara:strand:- start:3638 stop:3961 length:324 start_codon:yes stop_codon:yes gene_type:complete